MWQILLSGLLLGLIGEAHCVGMCGPIALIIPVDKENGIKRTLQLIVYHAGRILTYGIIGFLFGLAGKGLELSGLQQKISLVFGVLMVLVAFFPTARWLNPTLPGAWGQFIGKIKSGLNYFLRQRSWFALFMMGFLNGFLPCGLVYLALVGALATGSPYWGAVYMMLFGLGTSPALMAITYMQSLFSVSLRRKLNKIIPYAVALVGILFILRGLGLNIMYLSPGKKHLQINAMKEKMYRKKLKKAEKIFHAGEQ